MGYRFIKWLKKPSGYCFMTEDGRLFDFMRYDTKVDLKSGYAIGIDSGIVYKLCKFPTINELITAGKVARIVPYREYDIMPKSRPIDFDAIVAEFKENGFEVSKAALVHNYNAWLNDYKSGYRCKSCHIFTPCGCNPLRFSATTLCKECKDWQTTYKC